MSFTIDIDIGGTYTDGFFSDGVSATLVKVDTTPHDLTLGFQRCLEGGAARLGLASLSELLGRTDVIRFSTTVCDNLLIQQKGPKLGLMVTAGFEASLYADPGSLFDFLISPEMVAGIEEEIDGEGRVVAAPDAEAVSRKARRLLQSGARMLVISLRNAPLNRSNEQRVKQILDREYPSHYLGHVPVLLSHQISLRREDHRRTTAALLNAYLHKELLLSLAKTEDTLKKLGYVHPLFIVHGNFGAARVARTRAIDTYNSGPAAAHYGAALMAKRLSLPRVLALDVGGTSTEVSVLRDGRPMLTPHRKIGGFSVGGIAPVIASLGAGGGSIARFHNGALTVGPESAGALPGPACYDLGGTRATVTDAFLAAGFLDPDYFMGGDRRLNPGRAIEALGEAAGPAGLPVEQTAALIIRTLVANIAAAVRKSAGPDDPAAYDLFAFGGGGGLTAPLLSEVLGIRRVFTFPFGAVFSAFGSANLEIVHQYEISAPADINFSKGNLLLEDWFQELAARARREFSAEAVAAERIRYQLLLETLTGGGMAAVREYDVSPDQRELPLSPASDQGRPPGVIWLRAAVPIPQFQLSAQPLKQSDASNALKGSRPVYWKDSAAATRIYARALLRPGARIAGPAVVESASTSLAVPEGWSFSLNQFSIGVLERGTP
ncbi:MAG: hydantoinase/oxoprolinase family protein [Thermodesulfobacteriota bacterium]